MESIKQLERENGTLRDLSLSTSMTAASDAVDSEMTPKDSRDKDRHAAKELKLLRRTIEEMELRIETQKQTLATRDESIHKLMDMLQAKGWSIASLLYLHPVIPPAPDTSVTTRLRLTTSLPRLKLRTKKYCSLINFGLHHYQPTQ